MYVIRGASPRIFMSFHGIGFVVKGVFSFNVDCIH